MSEKCDLCDAGMADHTCYRCEKKVCSSCIDENGLLCRSCKSSNSDKIEGIRIGYAPLRKMVNMPLFITGIAVIIVGMAVIMSSSLILPTNVEQLPQQQPQQPGGFIYIFPFPFVFAWGSPDLVTVIPLIIAAIALPIIMVLLMFRKLWP